MRKINEFGRSIVEILAVLALIGILSMVAISGLKYAFLKIKADRINDDLRFIAFDMEASGVLMRLKMNRSTWDVADFMYSPTSGYKMGIAKISDRRFVMHVYNLEEALCHETMLNVPLYIDYAVANYSITSMSARGCKPEDTNRTSYYMTIPLGNYPTRQYDTDGTTCVPEDDKSILIEPELPPSKEDTGGDKDPSGSDTDKCSKVVCSGCSSCQNGVCVNDNDKCSGGQICKSAICVCPSTHPLWNGSECVCESGYVNVDGVCVSCLTPRELAISETECNLCNREWNEKIGFCLLKCINGITFRADDMSCVDCDSETAISAQEADCETCPARFYRHSNMMCHGICFGFLDSDGTCNECNTNSSPSTDEEECNFCSERYWSYKTGLCYPKCPTDGYVRRSDGTCIACSYDKSFETSEANCDLCKENYEKLYLAGSCHPPCLENEFRDSLTGLCRLCDSTYKYDSTEEECQKCIDSGIGRLYLNGVCVGTCEEGLMRKTTDGSCVACDNPYNQSISEGDCKKCIALGYDRGYVAATKTCTPACGEKEMRKTDGSCVACSNTGNQLTSEAACNKCAAVKDANGNKYDWVYNSGTGYCYAPCKTSPLQMRKADGSCVDCTNSGGQASTEANCNVCINAGIARFYTNNTCYGACTNLQFRQNTSFGCVACDNTGNQKSTAEECKKCSDLADSTGEEKYRRRYDVTLGTCYAPGK